MTDECNTDECTNSAVGQGVCDSCFTEFLNKPINEKLGGDAD